MMQAKHHDSLTCLDTWLSKFAKANRTNEDFHIVKKGHFAPYCSDAAAPFWAKKPQFVLQSVVL